MSVVDDAPLTAAEILSFGPVVEATTWNMVWLEERRAPIAVAAGRPKLGRVFNEEGVAKAVLIRPCISRGRAIRGLQPVYGPAMLESNGGVFAHWPMYLDHVANAARGRSVKEMAGQVFVPWYDRDFVMEDDELYGYQKGGVLSEVWGNRRVRDLVGNNPDVLHTSISAWPKSGRPGPVPWNPSKRGMIIEGIRRQPQGSVDFVPRGGAGGRLQLAEGITDPDEMPWPEPEWTEEALAIVVSTAQPSYAAATMADALRITTQTTPAELREALREHAPHLLPALVEQAPTTAAVSAPAAPAAPAATFTMAEVEQKIAEAKAETLAAAKPPLSEEELEERFSDMLREQNEQRSLSTAALDMIARAEGLSEGWKADLSARYEIRDDGPAAGVIVEEDERTDAEGRDLSARQVVEQRVKDDLQRARDRIAEAQGKPRVTGEGDGTKGNAGTDKAGKKSGGKSADEERAVAQEIAQEPWAQELLKSGVYESVDDLAAAHGITTVGG